MTEGPWSRRNAYPRVAPTWWLVTNRDGAVVGSMRGLRVGKVTDIPGWGCLVSVWRGLRVGIIALTDDGSRFAVTPEDDEASWLVEPEGVPGGCGLIRTDLDGVRVAGRWTPAAGVELRPRGNPQRDPGPGAAIRRVSWEAPGGTLDGLLAAPDDEGPFPLVVYLHGGPWFGLRVGDTGDSRFWTSRGAALLQSGHAGSGILGEAMMWEPLRAVGMPGRDLEADGVLDGVRHLVESGVADPDRVYVYGFSAGGYLVNRIVTRPHPFTAAACWDGTADVRGFTGETHELQVFFRGCTPQDCPERWDGASPITRPEAVQVPITIISAGRSNLVAESAAWHTALVDAGVDSRLMTYPDEDHVFGPQAHESVLIRLARGWGLG